MTRIPTDPNGYKVNPSTGTIHTRYATHADGERTRTRKGVETLLDGKQGKACKTCYQTPRYADAPRPPQRRRVSANGTMTAMEQIGQPTRRLATNDPDAA